MLIVGADFFRWLVFGLCGLQMMDYCVMNSFVLDEEEWERLIEPTALRFYAFHYSKYTGIIANFLVMVCIVLSLSQFLRYVVPLQLATCAYNVAEMDLRAVLTVASGGPVEMYLEEFLTLVMISNCLRLFTSWLVYEYWCLMSAAAG